MVGGRPRIVRHMVGGGFLNLRGRPKTVETLLSSLPIERALGTVPSAKVSMARNSFVRRVLRMVRPVVDNEPVFRVLVNPAARN